jgi:hypothetical protein
MRLFCGRPARLCWTDPLSECTPRETFTIPAMGCSLWLGAQTRDTARSKRSVKPTRVDALHRPSTSEPDHDAPTQTAANLQAVVAAPAAGRLHRRGCAAACAVGGRKRRHPQEGGRVATAAKSAQGPAADQGSLATLICGAPCLSAHVEHAVLPRARTDAASRFGAIAPPVAVRAHRLGLVAARSAGTAAKPCRRPARRLPRHGRFGTPRARRGAGMHGHVGCSARCRAARTRAIPRHRTRTGRRDGRIGSIKGRTR